MASYSVDNYSVRQWSSRSTGPENTGIPITGIFLYEGDERRGQIYFYPDGLELRPPVYNGEKNQILLSFGMCQYQGTVAMLDRGPVRIFYNSTSDSGIASVRVPQLDPELGEAAPEADEAAPEDGETVPEVDGQGVPEAVEAAPEDGEAIPVVDEVVTEVEEFVSVDEPK